MGQLERYGLYVLCIVIFLILGVALWGGDPVLPAPPSSARSGPPPTSNSTVRAKRNGGVRHPG